MTPAEQSLAFLRAVRTGPATLAENADRAGLTLAMAVAASFIIRRFL